MINYFHNLAQDKRLTKNRFKEFLNKRYKDLVTDRILKNILSYFNTFIINLDLGMYCDSIENFANQDENVRLPHPLNITSPLRSLLSRSSMSAEEGDFRSKTCSR